MDKEEKRRKDRAKKYAENLQKKSETLSAPRAISLPSRPSFSTLVIDERAIFEMASMDCTYDEMARISGLSETCIRERYQEVIERGQAERNRSLRRKMMEVALSGNTSMLIWLAKQWLGHRDRQPDEAQQVVFNIQVNEIPN